MKNKSETTQPKRQRGRPKGISETAVSHKHRIAFPATIEEKEAFKKIGGAGRVRELIREAAKTKT